MKKLFQFEDIVISQDNNYYVILVNNYEKFRILNKTNPAELKTLIFKFISNYNCFKEYGKKTYLDLKIFLVFYKLQNLITDKEEEIKLEENIILIGDKKIERFIFPNFYILGFIFGDGSSGYITNKIEKNEKNTNIFSIKYVNKLKYISVSGKDFDILNEIINWYRKIFQISGEFFQLIIRFDNENKLLQFQRLLKMKSYEEIQKIFDMNALEIENFIEKGNIEINAGMAKKGKSDERFGSGITLYIEDEFASIVTIAFKNWKFLLNLYLKNINITETKKISYDFLAGVFDADGWVDSKGFSIRTVIYSYLVEKNYILDGKKNEERYYDEWKIGILLDEICNNFFNRNIKVLIRTDNLGTGFNFSELTKKYGIKEQICSLRSFIKNEDAIMEKLKQIIEIYKQYLNDVYYTRREFDEKYPGWREEKEYHFQKSELKTRGIITKIDTENSPEYFQLVKNDCRTCKIISTILKKYENEDNYSKYIVILLMVSKKLTKHGKMENGKMIGGYQTGGLGVHLSVSNSKEVMQMLFKYSRYKRKKNDIKTKTPYLN